MKISSRMKINLVFMFAVGFLSYVSFFTYNNTSQLIENARWVSHTYEVLEHIEALQSSAKDLETSQRGFLLTGRQLYLNLFDAEMGNFGKKIDDLRVLTSDNSNQKRRLDIVESVLLKKVAELKLTIKLRQEKSLEAAMILVNSDTGKNLMDEFRAATDQMKNEEMKLLGKRKEDRESSADDARRLVSIGSFLAVLVILVALVFINLAEKDRLRYSYELEQSSLFKAGLNRLYEIMRGDQKTEDLCQAAINNLATHLDVPIGAVHLANEDDDQQLSVVGGYAYDRSRGSQMTRVGEGLVGQVAKARQALLVNDLPSNYLQVNSGLGETTTSHLYLAPLIFDAKTVGVIELGSLKPFSKSQTEFVNEAVDTITMALVSARNRYRAAELLAKTQTQSEELTAQQEELRQTNEELQQQSEALRESEEELKSQAEELRQTNEELGEHTALLSQKNDEIVAKNAVLETSQKALEEAMRTATEANRAKSTFLANMSHELRTPLNSILILSDLIAQNKDKNLTAKQIEFAQSVHQSGADLLNLINDILDLSKVEAGKIELHTEDMTVADVAESMYRNFDHVAKSRGLNFTLDVADDLPSAIHTDRQRLDQILKNLLGNAFKFTSQGSVTLKVARPAPGILDVPAVAFSIIDTGCGIPKEKHQMIFEAFKQADSTISRKYGGSGLGLSIAKQLASLLGGMVTFQSEDGRGSTFAVVIPERPSLSQPIVPAVIAGPSPVIVEEAVRLNLQELKAEVKGGAEILIIEDDIPFANILAQIAKKAGLKPKVVTSGTEALAMIRQSTPQAILLDLKLPDMDGVDLLQLLNKDSSTCRIPVQVITGSDREEEAMHAGATGFLTKPISAAKLEQVLSKIQRSRARPIKKVLLVEGQSDSKGLSEQLEKCNLDSTVVASADDTLKLMQQNLYDLLIIDRQREDLSAVELLEKIRRLDTATQPPVVIYSDTLPTPNETDALKRYARSIIVRGAKSRERLLDEVQLFLQSVDKLQTRVAPTNVVSIGRARNLKNKKVLLVDDDDRNIFAILNVLEGEGLDVVVGKNGRECLEQLEKNPDIQLVLMDIMMPEMDGYEAMRRIRKEHRFTDLPIIALTAKAMKEDRAKCIEAGATDYLPKPIEIDKLLSIVAVWLGTVSRPIGNASNA